MNKTTHSHPPTIPVFHPKLKKIFKECREWLEHNDRNQQLEPISKLPEQQKYRRNLYKSEEILGM